MTMMGKVFKNGRSQAIRLPKEYRVDSKEVYIEKSRAFAGYYSKGKIKMGYYEKCY